MHQDTLCVAQPQSHLCFSVLSLYLALIANIRPSQKPRLHRFTFHFIVPEPKGDAKPAFRTAVL